MSRKHYIQKLMFWNCYLWLY